MKDHDLSRVTWRKSSYSNGQGGACIEVAVASRDVAIRDSKQPDGQRLTFTSSDWTAFLATLR